MRRAPCSLPIIYRLLLSTYDSLLLLITLCLQGPEQCAALPTYYLLFINDYLLSLLITLRLQGPEQCAALPTLPCLALL